jgi:hypothetical protein
MSVAEPEKFLREEFPRSDGDIIESADGQTCCRGGAKTNACCVRRPVSGRR